MDNHTVVQLKVIAKERGIRGYYKLRKVELIHALEAARLVEQISNIFDESIPNDPTPILQPTPWTSPNIAMKDKQNIKNFIAKSMQRSKILVIGCLITYHQNQRWLMKLSNRLKS